MSGKTGPDIIESGLVLCLDAANKNSYRGSGTTWTDLSGNGNNGTLTNGPTFSAGNQGSIVFDGTNDYISFGNNGSTTAFDFGTSNITFAFWIYPTNWADGTSRGIITKKANDASGGWVIYNDGGYATKINARIGLQNNFPSSTSVTTNIWQNWTLTRNSTTLSWYYNGVFDTSATQTVYNVSDTSVELQIARSQTWNGYFVGNISNLLFYNRALSATEVLQNYNATKSRFGR